MIDILIAALPVACVAWTVTQEEVFREVREWLCVVRDNPAARWWCRKLAYMPTCPYCLSHYVALTAVLVFHLRLLNDAWTGAIAAWFAVVYVANAYMTVYHLLRQALRVVGALAKWGTPPVPFKS